MEPLEGDWLVSKSLIFHSNVLRFNFFQTTPYSKIAVVKKCSSKIIAQIFLLEAKQVILKISIGNKRDNVWEEVDSVVKTIFVVF